MIRSTLLAAGLFTHLSAAETLLVPEQYPTIESAIASSSPGDVVLIGPGTFYESNLALTTPGKEITVQGSLNGSGAHLTTIDVQSQPNRNCFTIGTNSVVKNLILTGGLRQGFPTNGGAISIIGSSPTIHNCIIQGNVATYGGGIYAEQSSPLISNCQIFGNHGAYGGGISFWQCLPVIVNSTIKDNSGENVWLDQSDIEIRSNPGPSGTCCINGSCFQLDEVSCVSSGGLWLGMTDLCSDCPEYQDPDATGACCVSGACIQATSAACFNSSGSYAGDNTTCAEANCPSSCEGDVSENGTVDFTDLLILINNWGNCPG